MRSNQRPITTQTGGAATALQNGSSCHIAPDNRRDLRLVKVLRHALSAGAALAATLLTSCAPSTAGGVREMTGNKVEFSIPSNYQAVYRTVLEQSRKCHQAPTLDVSSMVVTGDLYADLSTGTVMTQMRSARGVDTFAVVDITAIDRATTRVVAHYAVWSPLVSGALLREWVLEGWTDCSRKH